MAVSMTHVSKQKHSDLQVYQMIRRFLEGTKEFKYLLITDQVNPKSNAANNKNQFWILDLLRLQESLDGLDSDGEAKGD